MTPYLVTPPASLPVSLAAMKAHLRVVHDDDDADIEAKQAGAVAMLDAWGGVLGRCIMPQVWAIDVTGPGPHLLPFPDATNVTADSEGDALSVTVTREGAGLFVAIPDATGDVTITATYGLPEPRRSAAEALVKLIVGNWFENREAVVVGTISSELPMAVNALIGALRWRRL